MEYREMGCKTQEKHPDNWPWKGRGIVSLFEKSRKESEYAKEIQNEAVVESSGQIYRSLGGRRRKKVQEEK